MRLIVRVTPNSAHDRVEECGVDAAGRVYLKVRVRAVPEDGKANTAVEKLIAKTLGLPKSAVRVVTGSTSRIKALEIDTDSGSAAARQIRDWMGDECDTD